MAYIGNQPGTGVRSRFIYTATASQTTFSGADDNSKTLKYADSDYIDVYLNGVCLVPGTDYTASTKTSVVLTQAASVSDTLEVVAYDIATISDTVSKADGGTFNGDLGITNASPDITLTNNTTEDTDGGRESTVTFKGLQSGGEESTLAEIRASHDATADDQKGDLIFKTNDGSDGASPTERLRIDSGGNFLIGKNAVHEFDAYGTAIMMQLESSGTSPYAGFGMVQNSNDTDSAPLIFGKSRGTSAAATTIVQDGDILGRIEFQGMDGADLETGASIFGVVDGTPGADDMPGRLVFNTTADGAHSATERMRIDSDGNVMIGTTSTGGHGFHLALASASDFVAEINNSSGTNPYVLMLTTTGAAPDDGNRFFIYATDSAALRFSVNNQGDVQNHDNSYGAISDQRVKEDISDATSQWDDIKGLKVRKFKLKDDVRAYGDDAKFRLGLISQEAEAVSPNLITENEASTNNILSSSEFGTLYEDGDDIPDGKEVGDVKERKATVKGIKYSILYMKAVKALQEAMARIETLETKVAALEAG